jgi:DNA-binding NarL/FixJ family response regulator
MMNTVSADRILKEKLAAREKWEHDRATEICEKKRLEEELEKANAKVKKANEKAKKAKENEDETKKENTELKLQLQVFQLHATGTTLADIAEKLDLSKDKVEEILMIK